MYNIPMFLETLQITFSATLQVLLLAAAGFWAVRGKMLDNHGLDQFTAVLVNILLPCFSFSQLYQNFSYEKYPFWWQLPVLYVVMAAAALAFASLTGLGLKDNRKKEFMALVGFQNCGNIPLVVVATMFKGAQAHELFVYIVLFIIGANLAIWTVGVWLLVSGQQKGIELKRMITPPLVTTVVTMLLLALKLDKFVPAVILQPIDCLGNCALPLAMFTVGGGLASINFKRFEPEPSILLIITKLVLFPAAALAMVLFFKVSFLMGFLIVLEAAVPSAVTLSLIGRYYDLKSEFTDAGVFITHIASVVTIPVFLTLYMKLSGNM